MKERPVLFSPPMVKAILDGSKTMTRRVVKPQPDFAQVYEYKGKRTYDGENRRWCWKRFVSDIWTPKECLVPMCPYGVVGDLLWVREQHGYRQQFESAVGDGVWKVEVKYSDESRDWMDSPAKIERLQPPEPRVDGYYAKRPSIHMPRWASRLILEIVSVKVQRLQDIALAEVWQEGIPIPDYIDDSIADRVRATKDSFYQFRELWDSINGEREGCSWESNPFVWAIEFRRI